MLLGPNNILGIEEYLYKLDKFLYTSKISSFKAFYYKINIEVLKNNHRILRK